MEKQPMPQAARTALAEGSDWEGSADSQGLCLASWEGRGREPRAPLGNAV